MTDEWAGPWQPAASYTPAIVPVETEISTALLQHHLLEGLIAHQSLLDSTDLQIAFEQSVEMITLNSRPNDEPHIATVPHSSYPPSTPMMSILSDVWKARLLLLLSAALYGTNFTVVKSIDEIDGMSVGMASTLRFGFAALAMLPLLFAPIDAELKHGSGTNGDVLSKLWEEPTRLSAGLAGMEIGLYNSVGYLAQAVGLKTTTASKVSSIVKLIIHSPVSIRIYSHTYFACERCIHLECIYLLPGGGDCSDLRFYLGEETAQTSNTRRLSCRIRCICAGTRWSADYNYRWRCFEFDPARRYAFLLCIIHLCLFAFTLTPYFAHAIASFWVGLLEDGGGDGEVSHGGR